MRDQVTLEKIRKTLSGCVLSFSWFGVSRSFERDERDEAAGVFDADSDSTSMSKKLIRRDVKEWKDLGSLKSSVKAWWIYNTLPYPVDGQRLFLISRREELFGQVVKFQADLKEKVAALNEARDTVVKLAKERLGRLYREDLFPASFTDSFDLEMREVSIEPPSYLCHTNAEEYSRQLQRNLADLDAGLHRFEQQTMQSMGELAGRMIASLEGGSAPRSTVMEQFSKLFKRVSLMNFAGTAAFKSAVEEAQDIINDCDMQDLRREGGIREDVKEKMEALLKRHQALQDAARAKIEAATV